MGRDQRNLVYFAGPDALGVLNHFSCKTLLVTRFVENKISFGQGEIKVMDNHIFVLKVNILYAFRQNGKKIEFISKIINSNAKLIFQRNHFQIDHLKFLKIKLLRKEIFPWNNPNTHSLERSECLDRTFYLKYKTNINLYLYQNWNYYNREQNELFFVFTKGVHQNDNPDFQIKGEVSTWFEGREYDFKFSFEFDENESFKYVVLVFDLSSKKVKYQFVKSYMDMLVFGQGNGCFVFDFYVFKQNVQEELESQKGLISSQKDFLNISKSDDFPVKGFLGIRKKLRTLTEVQHLPLVEIPYTEGTCSVDI
jgi:hypothetical protein